MRICSTGRSNWADMARKCLKIDSSCTICARSGIPEADICSSCLHQFRRCALQTRRDGVTNCLCPGCGLESPAADGSAPLSQKNDPQYCAECSQRSTILLQRIVAPYRYAYPVDKLIKRIKYRQDRQLARVFGTLLGSEASQRGGESLPQCLLPMPLHPARYRQRGYNQAQDIARWAGRQLGLPVPAGQVRRIVDTGSLTGLNRLERQQRILGAFRAGDAVMGKHVAIVDDVLTTGASARELARELYDSGATSVELWVLARTSSLRSGV